MKKSKHIFTYIYILLIFISYIVDGWKHFARKARICFFYSHSSWWLDQQCTGQGICRQYYDWPCVSFTEKQELQWCQLCHHWWHWRLSLWQPPVLPLKTKLASLQLSVVSVTICRLHLEIMRFGAVYKCHVLIAWMPVDGLVGWGNVPATW